MSTEKDNPESTCDTARQEVSETKSSEILDGTWEELSQDWQAQPTPKTDIKALIKRTRQRTRGAKFCFALNIFATLGLLVAFLYGIYDGQWGEPVNIYLGLGGLISLIFIYFEAKIRIALWSQLCDSPEKAIDHAIAGSESSMRYMWITKLSFLPFLPLVNWFVYTVSQTSDKAALPTYLIANGFMLVIYLIVDYLYRKRKKEYHQLLQMK
mgnify:CR=1 FL=1